MKNKNGDISNLNTSHVLINPGRKADLIERI